MTAPITKADVTNFATELAASATPTDAAWTDLLAWINLFDLTQTCEDAQTDRMAKIFLTAHMATMVKRAASSASGPVTGEKIGGVSRTYAALSTPSSLATTRYGQLYAETIGASLAAGPMVV